MPDKVSITFAEAELYIVRHEEVWANVVVDQDTATFMAIGSDGLFGASWRDAPRQNLKKTLVGLDFDGFCGHCGRSVTDERARSFWRTVWPHVVWAIGRGVSIDPGRSRA